MPERRLTVRIELPEEGFNDPVRLEVLGAMSMEQFQGKAPPTLYEGESAADVLGQLGAALDGERARA